MTEIILSFPQDGGITLQAVGIQGPGGGSGGGGVSDGDKGDITVSGSGAAWTIDNGAVSLSKMADLATSTILGRATAGTGAPEALTAAQVRTILNVADGATANASDAALRDRSTHTGTQGAATITGLAAVATSGSASDLSAGTLPAARFDDTAHGARAGGSLHANAVAAGAAGFMTGADKTKLDGIATGATAYTDEMAQDAVGAMVDASLVYVDGTPLLTRAALTGDATAAQGSNALTIAADAVTNAKLANVATATLKGRATAGTGDPEDLTATQAWGVIDDAALNTAQNWTKAQGSTPVALTDGANIATDASLSNVFTVTLGGNRTLDNPTNLVAGRTYCWVITQDGTGGRTLAYGSSFDFPGGTAPTLSTGAADVDLIIGIAVSTSRLLCVANLDFS